jgi:hypothetical protein
MQNALSMGGGGCGKLGQVIPNSTTIIAILNPGSRMLYFEVPQSMSIFSSL